MGESLPWLQVPARSFVSVEHPFLVKDLDMAIETLGGEERIGDLVENEDDAYSHPLYLRPEDQMSPSIPSNLIRANGVVLKITVPKRTGRKRKRGSSQPYSTADSASASSEGLQSGPPNEKHLLRSLQDNPGAYSVEPVGRVDQTHKFRVKYTMDASGRAVLANSQLPQKLYTQMMLHDDSDVPMSPSPELPPVEYLDPKMQSLISKVRALLEERPVWTRRSLSNEAAPGESLIRYAYQYAGYMFRSGPWREAIVRLGVDPRIDPKYRIYQTIMFQITTREEEVDGKAVEARVKYARKPNAEKEVDTKSHLFDGRKVKLDGKVWQACDITDPLIRGLVETDELRQTCEIQSDGWYLSSTWSKVKAIMKDKILKILRGQVPSDLDYQDVLNSNGNISQSANVPTYSSAQVLGRRDPAKPSTGRHARQRKFRGDLAETTPDSPKGAAEEEEEEEEEQQEPDEDSYAVQIAGSDVEGSDNGSDDDDLNDDEESDSEIMEEMGERNDGGREIARVTPREEDDDSDESEYEDTGDENQ
ncbi:MAG: hypothetical protein M4579_001508 [Chaenotheca gracillima]|nr:MAG: hypothetical protein M4579_001508 [Chaenotheca gracillima]